MFNRPRKSVIAFDILVILAGAVIPQSSLPIWLLCCVGLVAAEALEYVLEF